jgi:hypothetical protein
LPLLTPRSTIREDPGESSVEAFRATLAPQEETMKSFVYSAAVLGALALTTGTAAADALGEKGTLALGSDLNISFKSVKSSFDDVDTRTEISIQPSADYFLAPNASVGAFLRYDNSDIENNTAYGLGARVGYVIGLGKVSIWPRVGFSLARIDIGEVTFDDGDPETPPIIVDPDASFYFSVSAFAPLLFHPVDHLFIGIGPEFNLDVYASNDYEKLTQLGVQSTIGGYF